MTVSVLKPWRTALRLDCSLPLSGLGPVLLSALRRLRRFASVSPVQIEIMGNQWQLHATLLAGR
jgi:hypothetical protein